MMLLGRYGTRTELFVESYAALAVGRDPFRDYKRRLNDIALRALPRFERILRDPIEGLLLIAKANAVDIWMPWHSFHSSNLVGVDGEALAKADEAALRGLLVRAESIALLLDNAGEAVFDIAYALLLHLRQGARVFLVTKSQAYETDVTRREAKAILNRVAETLGVAGAVKGVEVIGTDSPYPAPAKGKVSARVSRVLDSVDAIISKGIANYEALIEYCSLDPSKTIVALRAKCPVLARSFRVPMGAAIVALGYDCVG